MSQGNLTPEEQFFKTREIELRSKIRDEAERKARQLSEKRRIADGLGTDDQSLVDRVHGLGLDGDVVHVLHLMPLVEVAWADGSVSKAERTAIMRAVAAHGIEPDSGAARFMASLLEARPGETLLSEMLELLRDLLRAKGMHPHSLVEACADVARASGGLLGFGEKISPEEQEVIRKISESIAPDSARKITDRLS